MSAPGRSDLAVAGIQMHSRPGDVDGNLRSAGAWTRRAVREGARLVVLPELVVSGYHAEAAAATRWEDTQRAIEHLSGVAASSGTWLVAPLAERTADGRLYDSAAVIDAGGALVAMKRKRALWGWEPRVFSTGEPAAPFETGGFSAGLLLCYEAEFPEPARALALLGAELLLLPAAWSRGASWRWRLQPATRALDNLCYLLRVNGVGEGLCGMSALVGPDGRERVTLGEEEEGLVSGMVEGRELERWRDELPYLRDLRAAVADTPALGGG